MNRFYRKKLSFFLLFVIAGGLILYSPAIRMLFTAFSTTVQTLYLDMKYLVEGAVERHFFKVKPLKNCGGVHKNLNRNCSGVGMMRENIMPLSKNLA